jgi:hypothetical protein
MTFTLPSSWNLVRALHPHERPLNILLRLLLQFGYTDQDKLDELSGKDNSFICRFTFEENGAPLTTVRTHSIWLSYSMLIAVTF